MEGAGTSLRMLAGIAALVAIAFVLVYLTRVVVGLNELSALLFIALLLLLPSTATRMFRRRT